MGDYTEPFAVIGELDGRHLEITARSAPAAAAAARYWRDEYGSECPSTH